MRASFPSSAPRPKDALQRAEPPEGIKITALTYET